MILPKVLPRIPAVHSDLRGHHVKLFGETPAQVALPELSPQEVFYTVNRRNSVRGMHLQVEPAQPKLVTCVSGSFVSQVVCLLQGEAYGESHRQVLVPPEEEGEGTSTLWVPAGWALGYRALEEDSRMLYLAGTCYSAQGGRGVHPFSAELALDWSAPGEAAGAFTQEEAFLSPADEALPEEAPLASVA